MKSACAQLINFLKIFWICITSLRADILSQTALALSTVAPSTFLVVRGCQLEESWLKLGGARVACFKEWMN